MPTGLLSLLLLIAVRVGATGPSWPIYTDVQFPEHVGPDGGRATVLVTVGDDATDIRLEVSGDDRIRIDPDNQLVVQLNALHPGQRFVFEVGFQPGPGRSYLAVSSHAQFAHAGAGGAVREYPFGSENAEQLREHTKCVMQDADGTWIRLMGCDEEAAAAPPTSAPSRAPAGMPEDTIAIATLRGAPPVGRRVRLEGYVVDAYRCPPCPPGAMCKPCLMSTAIFIADVPEHAPFSRSNPPADVAALAVDDPARFSKGVRYRFEVEVPERGRNGGVDATVVRSQRSDAPIWPEPAPAEQPGAPH